jgi:cytochrome b subunit of formate dehydrogenase
MAAPSPAPVSDSFKLRWDVLLFVAFVFSAMPHATGVFFHEWISLALVAVVVTHLVFNWSWIIRTTRQVFSRLPAEVRFNHIWDALLFVLFVLTILSGLLVSQQALPSMGLPWVPSRFWMVLHNMSATGLTVMIGVHIAMHLGWVWTRLRRKPGPAMDAAKGEEP